MKISTRLEFGIIALIDIAIYSAGNTAVPIASISERQTISAKYLEQILISLRQAKIIKGQKGAHGGYILARPAKDIMFSDIINALDPTILSDTEIDDFDNSSRYKNTIKNCLWDKMNAYLQKFAEQISLADIVKSCQDDEQDVYMYYI